jgi:hypothetical protein
MSNETIEITLDDDQRHYLPGDTLAGEYALHLPLAAEPKAVEISVLWYTEGKGDEDLAVHYFERQATGNGEAIDFRQPRRFSTDLPNSPLSYEGVIVKLRWCVRVRLFLTRGKEVVADEPFQLGQVPGVQLPAESNENTETAEAAEE